MGKPKIYGNKTACVPNREADMRRRNKAYRKGLAFIENEPDRIDRIFEKRLERMKADACRSD